MKNATDGTQEPSPKLHIVDHDAPGIPLGQKADSAELGGQGCDMLTEGVNHVAAEESLRRERGAAFGRWMHEQRQRRSSAGPRDCCLVSPETAHEHGHPLDDADLTGTDLAGTDDALAEAAFKRRSREAASSPPSPPRWDSGTTEAAGGKGLCHISSTLAVHVLH